MLFDAAETARSVAEVNRLLKGLVERHPPLANLAVRGELSNLKRHASGHVYFTLKDEESQLAAAFFRMQVARNAWQDFADGDGVVAYGNLSVYEARGTYQLLVSRLVPAGAGALFRQFERRKAELAAEGLFDESRKRPLPRFPRHVALVTSPTGAVQHDIRRTLARRGWPLRLTLVPAQVQGPGALATLLAALRQAQRLPGVQVVVFARGGGSLEDLWCFNEPELVRAAAACPVPVVSAVGHETDFTLLDFAADVRASTPTAAAELLSPDLASLRLQLDEADARLAHSLRHSLAAQHARLLRLGHRLADCAAARLQEHAHRLGRLGQQLHAAATRQVDAAASTAGQLQAQLAALDPEAVLHRGYVMVAQNGKRIGAATEIGPGSRVQLQFHDGSHTAEILPGGIAETG